MKESLPNRRCSADESPHETFKVLLGGFLYGEEFLGQASTLVVFLSLGKAIVLLKVSQGKLR